MLYPTNVNLIIGISQYWITKNEFGQSNKFGAVRRYRFGIGNSIPYEFVDTSRGNQYVIKYRRF